MIAVFFCDFVTYAVEVFGDFFGPQQRRFDVRQNVFFADVVAKFGALDELRRLVARAA